MKALVEWAKQENCTITLKPEKIGSMVKVAIGNNEKKIAVEQRLDPGVLTQVADKDTIYNSIWEKLVEKYYKMAYPERYKEEEAISENTDTES